MFTRIFNPTYLCLIASVGCAMCIAGSGFWLTELAVHWRLHMAVFSFLFSCAFIVYWRQSHALWMLLLTALFAYPTAKIYAPSPPPAGKEIARISILQFNVLYTNNKLTASIPWIKTKNADIVILQEINKERSEELSELKKLYPWSQIKLNNSRETFGVAIFSKLPVTKFSYVNIGNGWNNYSLTELSVKGKKLNLYELHAPSPMSGFFFEQRNLDLEVLAETMAKDNNKYRVLVGDLNNTVYSKYFQNLLTRAELHHAQQNYKIAGTWPSVLPAPFRIGIDHLLASKYIKINNRVVAKKQISDHLPVITTISLYE